jgi:adenosylcobinamide-phosphate synthase
VIPLWLHVILALLLDLAFGDPRWFPHPVIGIGKLALAVEKPLRKRLPLKIAGVVAVIIVILTTVLVVTICCWLAGLIHPLVGDLVSILLIYTALAMQSLRTHALAVFHPLVKGDLVTARAQVKMLVGRDTDDLDEEEITRATVESVAENTVDGVTAPLLFALIAGAPGIFFYKAVNTLDSTFGYKNERYLQFGWASAKFDDLVNFLPARISALLVPFSAALIGLEAKQAWTIFKRDRHNHPSPNGGQIESAMAGAMNIRLGGENSYFGKTSFRPFMGDGEQKLKAEHILQVVRMMMVTSFLVLLVGLLVRWALNRMWLI